MDEEKIIDNPALQRDSPKVEQSSAGSSRMPSGTNSHHISSTAHSHVITSIFVPRWGTPQEEWAQNWDRRSSRGSDSCWSLVFRPGLLHQAGSVRHPLCWRVLLLPAVRILPGVDLLSAGLHRLRLVLDIDTVWILFNIWESKKTNRALD